MIGAILVPVDGQSENRPALDTALALTARFDCALTGLGLLPPLALPHFIDSQSAAHLAALYASAADDHLNRISHLFADAVLASDLSARAEWLVVEGPPTAVLAEQARYANLLVCARPDPSQQGYIDRPQIETVIMDSGRPVLLVPPNGPAVLPGRRIVIGWNNSRESARAVADALPFLQDAEAIRIVSVGQTHHGPGGPAAELAMALARSGIDAEPVLVDIDSAVDPGAAIIEMAEEFKADLIVAGAKASALWQELVPGGVTRTLLDKASVPLLLSH